MGQVVGAMGGGGSPTTIRQFLDTMPDYSYIQGDSIVTDLLMTLAGHLTFQDMVGIVLYIIFSVSGYNTPLSLNCSLHKLTRTLPLDRWVW